MKRNIMRWPGFKRKAVTLSYDDGVVFDRKLIEIMDKYGLKGTFNIGSGEMGKGRRLSKEEARFRKRRRKVRVLYGHAPVFHSIFQK